MGFARYLILVTTLSTAMALATDGHRASAATGTASEFVTQLGDRAVGVLRATDTDLDAREDRFRGLLRQGFDLPFIGRFALGPYWRRATTEQRSDYLEVFGEYVLQTYSSRLGGYTGETMSIVAERRAGEKDSLVQTEIVRPSGPAISAEWRVRVIDGQYRIIDITIEGVSMAVTKRSEFSAVIQSKGIEGLIAALRARANKMPATSSRN